MLSARAKDELKQEKYNSALAGIYACRDDQAAAITERLIKAVNHMSIYTIQ